MYNTNFYLMVHTVYKHTTLNNKPFVIDFENNYPIKNNHENPPPLCNNKGDRNGSPYGGDGC